MNSSSWSPRCARSPTPPLPRVKHSSSSISPSAFGSPNGCWRLTLLTAVVLAMTVSGCGTLRTRGAMPEPPRAELLAPCRRPPPAPDPYVKTLVANHVAAMELLDDCALRQRELAAWAEAVNSAWTVRKWWQR